VEVNDQKHSTEGFYHLEVRYPISCAFFMFRQGEGVQFGVVGKLIPTFQVADVRESNFDIFNDFFIN